LKSICPNADKWPTEYMHQKALVAAANERHAHFLRDANSKLDAIDTNRDLSPEGKQRQRAELASEPSQNSKSPRRSRAPAKLVSMWCRIV